MPDINLSTLSGTELRRLLDTTRERGEAAVSYQILQEMAARRDRGGQGLFPKRRPAEPRIIAVNLGDPLEPEDDLPAWRPPPESRVEVEVEVEAEAEAEVEAEALGPFPAVLAAPVAGPIPRRARRRKAQPEPVTAPAAAVEAAPLPEPERPRSVWDDPPAQATAPAGLRLRAPKLEGFRVPGGPAAAFAAGVALGIGGGWWVVGTTREGPPPHAPPATIQTAAVSPRPLPVTPLVVPPKPEPALEAPRETTEEPLPPDLREGASPAAESVADAPAAEAVEPPAVQADAETPEPRRPAMARAATDDDCASEPTPADRTICGDRKLQRLQRELREAYAEALDAHEERALLRQRQLAWREARNTVSDPARLARIYEQRIRRLNAATAEARREP